MPTVTGPVWRWIWAAQTPYTRPSSSARIRAFLLLWSTFTDDVGRCLRDMVGAACAMAGLLSSTIQGTPAAPGRQVDHSDAAAGVAAFTARGIPW
ncbi:hypothetical protein GCM10010493_03750 [Streptomyces lavendulae subsp. grasserius]